MRVLLFIVYVYEKHIFAAIYCAHSIRTYTHAVFGGTFRSMNLFTAIGNLRVSLV